MNIDNGEFNNKILLIISLLIIFIYMLPHIYLGQDFYPRFGYDNLDSNVIWSKLLKESGKYFASNSLIIQQPMSGLPRVSFSSELSIQVLLYYLFNVHTAYIVNLFLITLLAFGGMVLSLKKKYSDGNDIIIYSVALTYSLLNFWPHAGLSVAGLPLLYYSYLIYEEKRVLSIAIIIIYVLYSSFVLTGIFLITICGLLIIIKMIKRKRVLNDIIFISILIPLYIIVEYRLLLSTIMPVFISHRTEFIAPTFNPSQALLVFLKMVFYEYGHNVKYPVVIVITTGIFFMSINYKYIYRKDDIINIIGMILFISALSVTMQSSFVYGVTSQIGVLKTIQLQRFYWLLPPFFYVLFFLVLDNLWRSKWNIFVVIILFIQFLNVAKSETNWRQLIKTEILKKESGVLTYRQFYSQALYREITEYIGRDQSTYRVVSLGLQPAAALYNGFYTIDGYFTNYPVAYKRQFHEIIEDELNKNERANQFFNNWGSVVILLSDELNDRLEGRGFIIPTIQKNEDNRVIHRLNINTNILRDMNCQYLFSAIIIENAKELNLSLEKYFENEESPWGIYLYSIN
jgi:hypothetical protein